MPEESREFQIFVKPVGARCNLACAYCYYLDKASFYPDIRSPRMADDVLERYIRLHIEASTGELIFFSWHGGEPMLAGLDYFRRIIELQKELNTSGRKIINGLQTNGTLINEEWAQFFSEEGFIVGLSIDGPEFLHNRYRLTRGHKPTHKDVVRGYSHLKEYQVLCEILCVVNSCNVQYPAETYQYFKQLMTEYITFLPLVISQPGNTNNVSDHSVAPSAFGDFLCAVFDEWKDKDIGKIKIQIIEEAVRTAFKQEHTLCIFKKICGGVPVVEHNGDFYACDHFVDKDHLIGNIMHTTLINLLDDPRQKTFGRGKLDSLPTRCLQCEVRDMCNGGCPRNRLIETSEQGKKLNYLCAGYKQFFTHCKPFIEAVAIQWQKQSRG